MVRLDLVLDGTTEASGPPFDPTTALQATGAVKVIGMPDGTEQGRPTVILRATLTDGREVWIETTLRLFTVAARALAVRYPDDGR